MVESIFTCLTLKIVLYFPIKLIIVVYCVGENTFDHFTFHPEPNEPKSSKNMPTIFVAPQNKLNWRATPIRSKLPSLLSVILQGTE